MLKRVKRRVEEYAKNALYGSSLYNPIRSGYQRLFDQERWKFRNRSHQFFSPFVKQGSLVFDVGAYVGEYSELFAEMGARVVAVEPNPQNCDALRRVSVAYNVQLENCAVGNAPGSLRLHICKENPTITTLSEEWFEAAQHSPAHSKNTWLPPIEMRVVTLDDLAAKYGQPDFVKIDVEGFDDRVIEGMSFEPAALSFEFNLEIPNVALGCIGKLSASYEFNFVRGMKIEFQSDRWLRAEELIAQLQLRCPPPGAVYGDVVARKYASV